MSNYKKKEVMEYLTRKPLSEQDLQMAYEAGQQTLDSIPEKQVASGEERVLNRQPFYQNPPQLFEDDSASPQVDGIPLYQGVKPGVAIEERMPIYLPPDMAPVMPQVPGLPDPQFKQIELATGGRAGYAEGTPMAGLVYVGSWEGPWTGPEFLGGPRKGQYYNSSKNSLTAITGPDGAIPRPGMPITTIQSPQLTTTPIDSSSSLKDQYLGRLAALQSSGSSYEDFKNLLESNLQKKATGGRAELKDGTKEPPKFIPMDLESVAFRLFRENLDNLTYNQKQTVYDHIEQNRNKKAKGGKAGSVTPMSNKLSSDPTGIGNFLETSLGQMLSKKTPNFLKVTTKLAAVTGTPLNALLGVAIDAEENKEKGLSDFETIAAGAYKGSTQDLLNFGDLIFRKLPEATYKKFVQDRPFLESLLNEPEYFQFADKQIDKYTSEKSVKDRIQNRAEYEVTKSIPINISDTEVPTSMSSKEFKNLVESKKSEILNSNPDLKNLYKQEELNLAYGGRVKFANGSDDQESDLYIPPLNSEEDFFGKSIKMLPKEGLQGLYFGIKETPKYEEEQPIEISGSTIKELKQYLASRMPEQRPEIGYRDENLNISASKGFGPFTSKGTMYEASYSPNKDVGTFFINKGPEYIGAGYGREDLGNFSISKTPFTTAAGYNYDKDNLSYGIQALVDKAGNKEAQARLKYKFANGGKVKK
jgi:hypothetical protein